MNAITRNYQNFFSMGKKPCNRKVAEEMWRYIPSIQPLHEACTKLSNLFDSIEWCCQMSHNEAREALEKLLVEETGMEPKLVEAYTRCALYRDDWEECNIFHYPDRGMVGAKYLTL